MAGKLIFVVPSVLGTTMNVRDRVELSQPELQLDLDSWVTSYSEQRTHQGAGASARPRCRRFSTPSTWRAKGRTQPMSHNGGG
jgi:hypothetical protein